MTTNPPQVGDVGYLVFPCNSAGEYPPLHNVKVKIVRLPGWNGVDVQLLCTPPGKSHWKEGDITFWDLLHFVSEGEHDRLRQMPQTDASVSQSGSS